MNMYLFIVNDYCSRQITHPSDRLFAFIGLEKSMVKSMGTWFWFGLPERFWDYSLLFTTDLHIHPPKDNELRNRGFPSWCWAGWNFHASYIGYYELFAGSVRKEVDWFLVSRSTTHEEDSTRTRDSSYAIALESQDFPISPEYPTFPVQGNKSLGLLGTTPLNRLPPMTTRTKFYEGNVLQPSPFRSVHLACWTMVSELYLPGTYSPLDGKKSSGDARHLKIFNEKGTWIGSILMLKSWIRGQGSKMQDTIVVSINKAGKYMFMLMSRSGVMVRGDDEVSEIFSFHTDKMEIRPWRLLNVMMIQMGDDGISERLGVGVVHEDGWLGSKPSIRMVELK